MSDVRRLELRELEGKVSRPAWLEAAKPRIERAPFDPRPPFTDADLAAASTREESNAPEHGEVEMTSAPKRSSLPPRKSVPPPPVVITRLPPPPADLSALAGGEPSEGEQRFLEAALELASLRARIVSRCEGQLLELAVGMAEAIIGREVSLDQSLLMEFAKTAIAALGDSTESRLRVSREAFQSLSELSGGPAVDVDGVRVELVLDHSLEGLGLMAETPSSRVDGRIRERLAAVLNAVQAEHRRSGAEDDA